MKKIDFVLFFGTFALCLAIGWYSGNDWFERHPDNAFFLVVSIVASGWVTASRRLI